MVSSECRAFLKGKPEQLPGSSSKKETDSPEGPEALQFADMPYYESDGIYAYRWNSWVMQYGFELRGAGCPNILKLEIRKIREYDEECMYDLRGGGDSGDDGGSVGDTDS